MKEIFSKQEVDGSWCSGGSWAMKPSYQLKDGWDLVTPMYNTTVRILPLLGEMGFTVQDARVRKACDYVLRNGYFCHPVFQNLDVAGFRDVDLSPCRLALYLMGLSAVVRRLITGSGRGTISCCLSSAMTAGGRWTSTFMNEIGPVAAFFHLSRGHSSIRSPE